MSAFERWALGLVACLWPWLSIAQAPPLAEFAHSAWTVNDGAPADIWTLARAPQGYLWLGTGLGLFRFDGVRFDRYPLREGQRLQSNNINALHVGAGGEIWIGLFAGGVVRLRDGVATSFGEADGLPGGRVLQFARDRDGALWAAASRGLARFDGRRWQRVGPDWQFNEPGADYVFIDHRGVLWVAGAQGLHWLPPGGRRFHATGEVISRSAVLAEDRAGRVWISDGLKGTRPLPDYAGGAPAPKPADRADTLADSVSFYARAKQMLFAEDGSLWLTENGVGVRRLRDAAAVPVGHSLAVGDMLETFSRRQGLPADIVVPLVQGMDGEVWVGSNHGLSSFRVQQLRRVPEFGTGEPAGFTVAVLDDGVLTLSGHRALHLAPPQPPLGRLELDQHFRAVTSDATGAIWWVHADGVWREAGGRRERMWLPGERRNYGVQAFAPDQRGGAWVAAMGVGVFHVGPDGARREPRLELGARLPTAITVAADGTAWFGYDDELLRLSGDELRRYTSADGLRVGRTTTLHVGAKAVYVGGEGGFSRFDGRRFSSVAAERDDAFAHVSGAVETAAGDLWLNGGRGLVQVQARDLPALFDELPARLNYRLLDWRDGLPGIAQQATPVPTLVQDRQHRLWVATNRGIAWLEPDHVTRNERAIGVEIQHLRAGDRHYRPDAGLALPAGTRNVVVRYSALTLAASERARFRHRLDGVDTDWQDADTRREAAYANLGPGDYRFRVVAANGDGVWSREEASLPFRIEAKFWQTRSFAVVCGLALLGLAAGAYLLRTRAIAAGVRRQLEARHHERERIARDLHDTLLQSTQALIVNVQGIASRLPGQDPVRGQIEVLLDRADDVVLEARERVRDLRTSGVDGEELLCGLQTLGQQLGEELGRDIVFRAVGIGTPRTVERTVGDELHRIAQEAVRNAFRHAHARQIEVEITYLKSELLLRVRDDGSGIPLPWVQGGGRPGHWGLQGMRERAQGIGAKLTLSSATAGGTEIEVRVPGRVAYAGRTSKAPV